MIDIRSTFAEYLPEDEIDDFVQWAFGAEYEVLENPMAIVTKWNDRHRDYLTLSIRGTISEDIPRMIELWERRS